MKKSISIAVFTALLAGAISSFAPAATVQAADTQAKQEIVLDVYKRQP